MSDGVESRRCGRCGASVPLPEFAWRRKHAGQRDNWCSSSTTSATRPSASPKAYATAPGPRCSRRSTSARSFVQTVTVAEPPVVAASHARL
jgi:hypothetical protein